MKILIVEDEAGMREALIKALTDEGYSTDGAADGEEGYDLAGTGAYDLILLDIMLPKRSGLEVLRALRKDGYVTPVILLTARSALEDKISGMDLGADDYLTKPFEMKELFARIRMVNRRAHQVTVDNDLTAGDMFLDLKTFELSSRDHAHRVKLGSKEYSLMEYFMLNRGIILTREQITDKIWGYDSDTEYNNVDVYVSFLRKKMQFIGTKAHIDAVRGIGYVLKDGENDDR